MSLDEMLEPIRARIRLLIGRAVIAASKNSDGKIMLDLELLAGEKRRGIELMQQFAFSSRPKGDVSAVALFMGGSRDNGIVIASRGDSPEMNDYKLEEGEAIMHSPFGQKILFKNDGNIEIKAAAGKKILMKSEVEISENLIVQKEVTSMKTGLVTLSGHNHDSGAGNTTPPIPGT